MGCFMFKWNIFHVNMWICTVFNIWHLFYFLCKKSPVIMESRHRSNATHPVYSATSWGKTHLFPNPRTSLDVGSDHPAEDCRKGEPSGWLCTSNVVRYRMTCSRKVSDVIRGSRREYSFCFFPRLLVFFFFIHSLPLGEPFFNFPIWRGFVSS